MLLLTNTVEITNNIHTEEFGMTGLIITIEAQDPNHNQSEPERLRLKVHFEKHQLQSLTLISRLIEKFKKDVATISNSNPENSAAFAHIAYDTRDEELVLLRLFIKDL